MGGAAWEPRGPAGAKGLIFVARCGAEEDREVSALAGIADAVVQSLLSSPSNLPAVLREAPLFLQQGIASDGFGLSERADLAPLRAFDVKAAVTRKTLLPAVVSLLADYEKSPGEL
eukprot:gnl/TRDRNA2_/TRDRNA2_166938_c0_seq1.p1 gnl/TRDRNA2_/TRDRNA2_166938_c0~~gnl/TRDRNA2_/TRDRNA2_166938_c0_seq1.p1  ORF type:complete len:116 (+),score=26.28 gnl/TRDRNA2_/TRDRNA2_166938_c0_seq1:77-424(+)